VVAADAVAIGIMAIIMVTMVTMNGAEERSERLTGRVSEMAVGSVAGDQGGLTRILTKVLTKVLTRILTITLMIIITIIMMMDMIMNNLFRQASQIRTCLKLYLTAFMEA
jgi:hypothetical protein